MVIQADGEKYACDACVRGHRVSSCTHKDRHLNHINKKGRPVSQCQHCRGLRKNRASHVKCVCAELGLVKEGGPPGAAQGQDHAGCLCVVGQKCSCAAKREAFAADNFGKVAALNVTCHRRASSKPSIPNRRSDSVIPKFQSGHHPPLHRHNFAAHEYSPYPIKRSHSQTLHGPGPMGQRSVDNLSLAMHATGTDAYAASPSSLPVASYLDGAGAGSAVSAAGLGSNSLGSASVPSGLNQLMGPASAGLVDGNVQPFGGGSSSSSNARWSINDFSGMAAYSTMCGNDQSAAADPLSAMSDTQFNWADWDFNGVGAADGAQQASSVVSVEHPGLSRSSSGTASDTGESSFNPPDFGFSALPTASSFSAHGGGAWPTDGAWPFEPAGLQDKTPLGAPSQSTRAVSGAPMMDYFGDSLQHGAAKYATAHAAAVATSAPAQFADNKTQAMYGGPMGAVAVPQTMAARLPDAWQEAERSAHAKMQGQPHAHDGPFDGSSWL